MIPGGMSAISEIADDTYWQMPVNRARDKLVQRLEDLAKDPRARTGLIILGLYPIDKDNIDALLPELRPKFANETFSQIFTYYLHGSKDWYKRPPEASALATDSGVELKGRIQTALDDLFVAIEKLSHLPAASLSEAAEPNPETDEDKEAVPQVSTSRFNLSGEWTYYGGLGVATMKKVGNKYEGEAMWTPNPAKRPHYRFHDCVLGQDLLLRGKFEYVFKGNLAKVRKTGYV